MQKHKILHKGSLAVGLSIWKFKMALGKSFQKHYRCRIKSISLSWFLIIKILIWKLETGWQQKFGGHFFWSRIWDRLTRGLLLDVTSFPFFIKMKVMHIWYFGDYYVPLPYFWNVSFKIALCLQSNQRDGYTDTPSFFFPFTPPLLASRSCTRLTHVWW